MPRRRWAPILVLLGFMAAFGCRSPGPEEHALLTILGQPSERTTRPYCVPDGRRVPSAAFRQPTWCTVHYPEGNAIWQRDAYGRVLTGSRMWMLHYEDSLRWPHLRDSVVNVVRDLARGGHLCSSEFPAGNGGLATGWLLPGYRLGITRHVHEAEWSGGYLVYIGMARDSACPALPGPPA